MNTFKYFKPFDSEIVYRCNNDGHFNYWSTALNKWVPSAIKLRAVKKKQAIVLQPNAFK